MKHWIARGVCLIFIPLMVYMASFKIHFLILNHSGPGDAQMSSLFQANLIGNDFAQNPLGNVSHVPLHSEIIYISIQTLHTALRLLSRT